MKSMDIWSINYDAEHIILHYAIYTDQSNGIGPCRVFRTLIQMHAIHMWYDFSVWL